MKYPCSGTSEITSKICKKVYQFSPLKRYQTATSILLNAFFRFIIMGFIILAIIPYTSFVLFFLSYLILLTGKYLVLYNV